MRTLAAVVFVLALGVSFSVVGSGAGVAIFGQDANSNGGLGPMDQLNESGTEENADVSGDVAGDDEANIVGFIIDGTGFVLGTAVSVVIVPTTLIALGVPPYIAWPIGSLLMFLASVGVIQFATGRVWR